MTRRLDRQILILCCLAIVGVACSKKEPKGIQITAVELVPPQADLVFGLDIEAVRNSALAGPLWAAIQADADMKAVTSAFASCRPELGKLRLTGATLMDKAEESFLLVMEGPGVGERDLMRCVEREYGKATGQGAGLLVFTTRGDVSMTPQLGGGWAILLNKNALALVSKDWEKSIFEILDAHSKSAKPAAASSRALSKDTLQSNAWLTFRAAGMADDALEDIPAAKGLTDVVMKLDLSAGLAMKADLVFKDKAQAAAFNTAAQVLIASAKDELKAEMGAGDAASQIPAKVIDSFKLGPSPSGDTRLQAELTIGKQELPVLLGMAMAAAQ